MRNQQFFSFHNICDSQRKRTTCKITVCMCISLPPIWSMTMRGAKCEHTFILRARASDNSSVTAEWMGTGRCAIRVTSLQFNDTSRSIRSMYSSTPSQFSTQQRNAFHIKVGTTPATRNFLQFDSIITQILSLNNFPVRREAFFTRYFQERIQNISRY